MTGEGIRSYDDFDKRIQVWKKLWEEAELAKLLNDSRIYDLEERMRIGRIAVEDEAALKKKIDLLEKDNKKLEKVVQKQKLTIKTMRDGREKTLNSLNNMNVNLNAIVQESMTVAFENI